MNWADCIICKKILNWCQRQVDKGYEKYGLTPKLLEHQSRINKLRHNLDITDERTVIDDNEGFVQ